MWYDVTKRVTTVSLDWRKKLEILLNYFQRQICCCKSRKLNFEKKKWKLNFSLKKYGSQFCDAHNFSRCFNFEGMKWTDATVHKFGDFIKTRNRKKIISTENWMHEYDFVRTPLFPMHNMRHMIFCVSFASALTVVSLTFALIQFGLEHKIVYLRLNLL